MIDKQIDEFQMLNEMTLELVDNVMEQFLELIPHPGLRHILEKSISSRGLRERPVLLRLGYEAVGGQDYIVLAPAMAAIEYLHYSTLIIDDILDDAILRSNTITVREQFGYKKAITVGELLNAIGFLAIDDLWTSLDDSSRYLTISAISKILKRTQIDLYIGQYLDLLYEKNDKIKENEYLDMVTRTTSSTIRASLAIGGIIGNGTDKQIEQLDLFGEAIGIAFQVRDDILDVIGPEELIGKKVAGDIRRKKLRLPIIAALNICEEDEKEYLRRYIRSENQQETEVDKCIQIILDCGAIEYCKYVVNKYSKKGEQYLTDEFEKEPINILSTFSYLIANNW